MNVCFNRMIDGLVNALLWLIGGDVDGKDRALDRWLAETMDR